MPWVRSGQNQCGASSQADFIQKYVLRKGMFRKQRFHIKRYFWLKKIFLTLFGPFLTLFNAKTPFQALEGEIFPPISSLRLHLLPSHMPY